MKIEIDQPVLPHAQTRTIKKSTSWSCFTFCTILPLCLVWVLFSPRVHAVRPPPDGGYPGRNTAEGNNGLLNLTTGTDNTALGFTSLANNVTGSSNTAVGAGALVANTAGENTATGAAALSSNTTGTENTATGALALFGNTTGIFNTA